MKSGSFCLWPFLLRLDLRGSSFLACLQSARSWASFAVQFFCAMSFETVCAMLCAGRPLRLFLPLAVSSYISIAARYCQLSGIKTTDSFSNLAFCTIVVIHRGPISRKNLMKNDRVNPVFYRDQVTICEVTITGYNEAQPLIGDQKRA